MDTVHEYSPDTNTWTPLPSLPQPAEGGAAALIDRDIYFVGGRSPAGYLNKLWVRGGREE